MASNPLFGILTIVSTAIFAIGILGNLFFWLQGSESRDNVRAGLKPAPARGLLFIARACLRGLASGKVWWSFLVDSLLQRRLWRISRLRWLMQIGFIWGMVELFFVGSVGNMLAERGVLPVTKDTPWFATVSELGTVLVLLGVGIALYRRFIAKEIELPTSVGDIALVVLLATIVLAGVLLEAVRLLADGVPAVVGWYSFIGYAVAQVLRPLPIDWTAAHAPVWWFHIVVSFGLIAYLPYSKLFHLFTVPAVLAAAAMDRMDG